MHISAAALGLAALFRAAPLRYDVLRLAGAAYLVCLGIQTLRSRDDGVAPGSEGGAPGVRRAFARGAVTNLLNPKMALFTIALLPQFVDTQHGNVAIQFVVLGACFIALEIAVDGTVGILAGRMRRVLARRRATKTIHVVSGSVFLGLGAKVAVRP